MGQDEEDDEDLDQEYTPEMAQELMRRGLVLDGTRPSADS